jgi:primosomal protein N'
MKIKVSRKTSDSAEKFINNLHIEATKLGLKIQINKPTPSFYEKSHGNFNWQIIVKSKQRILLIDLINSLKPGDWTYDIDPINLL